MSCGHCAHEELQEHVRAPGEVQEGSMVKRQRGEGQEAVGGERPPASESSRYHEDTLPWTVVGVYPAELDEVGTDGATYVEWVETPDPESAVVVAQSVDGDRKSRSLVVAVFPGHMVCMLYNKGLMSGERVTLDMCPDPTCQAVEALDEQHTESCTGKDTVE